MTLTEWAHICSFSIISTMLSRRTEFSSVFQVTLPSSSTLWLTCFVRCRNTHLSTRVQNTTTTGCRIPNRLVKPLHVLSPIRTAAAWIPEIPLGNQALRREDFLSLLRAARGPQRSGMEDHVSRGGGSTAVREAGPQRSGRQVHGSWGGGPRWSGRGASCSSGTQFRPRPQGRETRAESITLWPLGVHEHFLDITHLRPQGKAGSSLSQVPRTSVSQLDPWEPWKSQGLSFATLLVDRWHGLGAC